jgi:integrase/recombinase XerD
VTRLRRIMLEELQRRNYSAITTRNYLRVVTDFAKHFGKSPDTLGLNELRSYQAYLLRERKLTPGSVVNQVAALRFFSSRHSSAISSAISCLTRRTSVDCQQCSVQKKFRA